MISMNKITALYIKQMKNIGYNLFIAIGFVMPLLFAFLFAYIMPGTESIALSMGVLTNIAFVSTNTMCVLIAEEKEKNTLNVLITSTVSALDFLLSNALTTITMTSAINILVYLICAPVDISFLPFMLVTTFGAIAAVVLGAIIGLVSKNQMTASSIITPFALIFMMVPMLAGGVPSLRLAGNMMYSQQTIVMLSDIANGVLSLTSIGVIAANTAVFSIAFVLVYKRFGLGK